MGNQTVLYEQSGNIVTITYNRPDKQNAINGQMRKELNDAWDKFSEDETAWVAILTGSGTTFCGGADLRDSSGSTGDFKGTFWEKPTINSFESGKEIYKPVIAAVNGFAMGGGFIFFEKVTIGYLDLYTYVEEMPILQWYIDNTVSTNRSIRITSYTDICRWYILKKLRDENPNATAIMLCQPTYLTSEEPWLNDLLRFTSLMFLKKL